MLTQSIELAKQSFEEEKKEEEEKENLDEVMKDLEETDPDGAPVENPMAAAAAS